MATGIFFHYQQGERLKDFPQALETILEKEEVFLYDALYPSKPKSSFDLEPIAPGTLCEVHSTEMIERVKVMGNYDGAFYSAAGTVAAATKICSGEITNAFVFTGYGDHHAGSTFFGGGCYFNGAALAISEIRRKFPTRRFAIIDTDAHHGDGTWELFENDREVLYLCLCTGNSREYNNNVNIHLPPQITDSYYCALAQEAFERWVTVFHPEIIFWNWGYDGTTGEYGDMGLSPEVHPKLATQMKALAQETCSGRLIIILCGGSGRDLARFLIPRMIKTLIGWPSL